MISSKHVMYYAKFYDTLIMFLDEELRNNFVAHNKDSSITVHEIMETYENLPVVLFSCLNCANCIQIDNILSRSIVCCLKKEKEIAWVGFDDRRYFTIFNQDMQNAFFIDQYCIDFMPKKMMSPYLYMERK